LHYFVSGEEEYLFAIQK